MRILILLLFIVSGILASFKNLPKQTEVSSRQSKPNVILIFMDDMGYGDPVCYGGGPYQTPNIDKLAYSGIRFTNFYAAQAVCTASRSALLTGCYPTRIGISGAIDHNAKIGLNLNEETIPELLKNPDTKQAWLANGILDTNNPTFHYNMALMNTWAYPIPMICGRYIMTAHPGQTPAATALSIRSFRS